VQAEKAIPHDSPMVEQGNAVVLTSGFVDSNHAGLKVMWRSSPFSGIRSAREHGGNTSILENKYDDPVASRISLVQYNNRSIYRLTGYFYRLQNPSFESTTRLMVFHDEIILF
jgi:hypothetical protein